MRAAFQISAHFVALAAVKETAIASHGSCGGWNQTSPVITAGFDMSRGIVRRSEGGVASGVAGGVAGTFSRFAFTPLL